VQSLTALSPLVRGGLRRCRLNQMWLSGRYGPILSPGKYSREVRGDLTWTPFLPNVSSCAARAGSPQGLWLAAPAIPPSSADPVTDRRVKGVGWTQKVTKYIQSG